MNLTFLGSGACFYPALHNTSAYFVFENNLILLDCGETVYEQLLEREDLDKYDQIYVIITHLHADHVGSLGSLLSYCSCILKRRIHVIYPQTEICNLLSLMGIVKEFYNYKQEFLHAVEGLDIVPVQVSHASDMKCYGYEIRCRDWHIYYSGDAAGIPDEILKKFNSGEIQRIYQDTSTHKCDPPSHMYVGDLEDAIPFEARNRVVCMHLDCDCRKELEERGFSVIR